MALSIGLDITPDWWHICIMEQGQIVDLHKFPDVDAGIALLRQLCDRSPAAVIVLALDVQTPLQALSQSGTEQGSAPSVMPGFADRLSSVFLSLGAQIYCAPSAAYLPAFPPYRRLMRASSGNARDVSAVLALLYQMRVQGADWQEMNFLWIRDSQQGVAIQVLKDGQIINGLGQLQGSAHPNALGMEIPEGALEPLLEEAFWEGLTQELAGLQAVHPIKDLVILSDGSHPLTERLAEHYQVYLFPHPGPDMEGYESALGAAVLAEGLAQPGPAAELVEHLQLRPTASLRPLFFSAEPE
jgi:hypothetical protein